jgi:hypothetical protein
MKTLIQPTIEDESVTMNGRQKWLSLEEVLEAYIDIIEKGKIRSVEKDYEYEGGRMDPWIISPYSDYDLQKALEEFNKLVEVISARLPTPLVGDTGHLASEAELEGSQIDGFAREFLAKAKRPTFKYIAPGIRIQTEEEVRSQPYDIIRGHEDEDEEDWKRPVLLFRGDTKAENLGSIFNYPFDYLEDYPSGAYLAPYRKNGFSPFSNGFKFVLPFRIGGNGHARTSDGSLIGETLDSTEEPTGKDVHDQLYSSGYNPFIEEHYPQLHKLLENWVAMVVEGHWQVDENGVAGGLDKFREADAATNWQSYVLPQSW